MQKVIRNRNSWQGAMVISAAIALALAAPVSVRGQASPNPTKDAPESPLSAPAKPIISAGLITPLRTINGYITAVDSVTFSADSATVISGGRSMDPHIKVWSVASGEELNNFRAQNSSIFALDLAPDGSTLVSSGEDSDLYFWDVPLNADKFIAFDHTSKVLALAITPDSSLLVSGGLDGIKVWTLHPRRLLYQLSNFGTPGYALAIHPNGFLLASGDDRGRVRIWNLQDGSVVSEFFPHRQEISKLAITPDGNILITASFDRTIKLWNIKTGALLHTLVGHSSAIRGLALSPDGRTLASAGNDGIRIWNVEDGQEYQHLTQHTDWVSAVVFSPNGRYLASGGFDRSIIIWSVPEVLASDPAVQQEQIFNRDPASGSNGQNQTFPATPIVPLPPTGSPQKPSPQNPFPVNPKPLAPRG